MRKSSRPGTPSRRQVQFTLAVVTAAAAGAVLGPAGASSAAVPPPTTRPADWTNAGGDNAYVNGANWNPAITGSPANANNEFLTINNGGTAVIAAGDAAEGAFLNLGLRTGDTGSLQITGGTLTVGELRVGGRDTIANDLAGDWLLGGFTPNGGGTGSVVQSGSSVVNVTFTHGNNPDTGANYEPPIQSTYIGNGGLASGNAANGSYTIKDSATLLNGIATNDQLVVGSGVGAHGTFLQQDSSTVTSTGSVIVGRQGGTASYTLTGGALNAQGNNGLFVADGATADGTAVATDGSGHGTVATFTQTAGTVTLANALEVGRRGGTGTYTMSGGTLSTGAELRVGSNGNSSEAGVQSGVGSFALSGGSITVATNLHVGIGSSTLSNTVAGNVNQTGGSVSLTNAGAIVAIGNGLGVSGTYDISGGSLTATGTSALLHIGRNSGSGLLKISGTGTVSTNTLTLDSGTPSTGTASRELRIENGGTLNVAFWEMGSVTPGAGVTRTVTMTGGTLNVNNAANAHRGGRNVQYNFSGGNATFLGNMPIDTSTVNVSGTANVQFGNYRTGSGTTSVSGGSFSAAAVNDSGNQGGTTTISGGTVNVTGNWNVTNGTPGTAGSLTISGGNVTVNSMTTGGSATLQTMFAISGGTVSIPTLTLSSGTTFKTDNAISLTSAVNVGNATVNVNTGSLSLAGSLNNSSRTLTKTGPGTLTISSAQTNSGTATLTNNAGTLNLNSNANGTLTTAGNLTVNANATTNFGASQSLKALNVANGVTATLVANGARTLTTPALNLNATGTLDLANNALAVPYTTTNPLATIRASLASAYNNGAWNQPGITSSTAAATNRAFGLAYVDTGTQVQVTYARMGDLTLDGKINGDDFTLIDRQVALNGFGSPATWTTGDFNYDGILTSGDYLVMDIGFGRQQGALSPDFLADRQATFGDAYVSQLLAAVPEPSSLFAACGLALPLLSRRRRTSR